MSLICFK